MKEHLVPRDQYWLWIDRSFLSDLSATMLNDCHPGLLSRYKDDKVRYQTFLWVVQLRESLGDEAQSVCWSVLMGRRWQGTSLMWNSLGTAESKENPALAGSSSCRIMLENRKHSRKMVFALLPWGYLQSDKSCDNQTRRGRYKCCMFCLCFAFCKGGRRVN